MNLETGRLRSACLPNLIALARLRSAEIPESARRVALFSLFDWMTVGWAGRNEPLAGIIRDYIRGEGGRGVASLIGGGRAPARAASLVNGSISHALDYDDTHFGHIGHPSVAIIPAALAAAEETAAPAAEIADAFLVGAEASVRVGMVLGRGHYLKGFHQTATAGAFGATVAAGRIYGLDEAQMRNAIGLCATRASGLKSQFGTMGKPYNAGIAAANGVECAALAKRGFTSCDDDLDGPQGFVETHSDAPDAVGPWTDPAPGRFLFEDVKYKFHACCHGTHAMIEALASLLAAESIGPGQVDRVLVRVNPRWLRVCDIKAPRTGLEVKFSYVWLAGMVFHGTDTSADSTYTDALCADAGLAAFAKKVVVEGDEAIGDTACVGTVELADGRSLAVAYDLATPLAPAVIERGLRRKSRALIGAARADRYWAAVTGLDRIDAGALAALIRR